MKDVARLITSRIKFQIFVSMESDLRRKKDENSYSEIVRLTNGISDNAGIFVNLFGRLDPLSAKRRETKTEFSLYDALCGAVAVFDKECQDKGIQIYLDCPSDIKFIGWKQDIYTIMVNLLDNSLFWIVEKECVERRIKHCSKQSKSRFYSRLYRFRSWHQ